MKINTVIIGSGMAGMSAALYLKRAGIDFVIIEKSAPGGQVLTTSNIENYPGTIKIDGPTFAMNTYMQLNNLKVDFVFDEVKSIDINLKKVICNKSEYECDNIIIATGRSPKHLNLPMEDHFIGKGIGFCALCDGTFYKDKDVLVVGAGNSAFEESLYLSKICKSVTILARSEIYRADQKLVDEVKAKENIKIINGKTIKSFIGSEKIEGVILNDDSKMDIDGIFIYVGQIPNTEIFKSLNILNENGYIVVNDKNETSIKGVYAVGDCTAKNLYQIVSAVSEGANAATSIIRGQ